MNQLKRYEDLPFQKKLFFVFGFSLVFCIVVAVCAYGLLYQDPGAQ